MAQNRHQSVKRLIFVTILAHIALSLWFVERALLNGDEGWYLYAARQIASGLEPYRDFAFFQMPVYPRALSSLVQPGPGSIIAGRWLSWLTLLMATGIIGLAAMRLRGLGGMLLAVIAVGLNPLVLGTSVLVKPYALCLLLVSGGVFMMTSRDGLRIAAGFCLFGLGAGARLSLLLPLLVLVWAHRRSHVRESLLGSVVGLSLALYPSLSVPWTVLWENWVGAHLGDGAGAVERLQWLGWQPGLCGFFAASFWPG